MPIIGFAQALVPIREPHCVHRCSPPLYRPILLEFDPSHSKQLLSCPVERCLRISVCAVTRDASSLPTHRGSAEMLAFCLVELPAISRKTSRDKASPDASLKFGRVSCSIHSHIVLHSLGFTVCVCHAAVVSWNPLKNESRMRTASMSKDPRSLETLVRLLAFSLTPSRQAPILPTAG